MSQVDHDEGRAQVGYVVVESLETPLVFMNADSEIFVCTDEVTKVTTDHAGTE